MKKSKKKTSTAGIRILQLLVVVVIMLMAGAGFGGREVNAASTDECIVVKGCGYEEDDKKYTIGKFEIVVSYEEMSIYKENDLVETFPYYAWDLAWIIDNKLYYSDRMNIYYYDFSAECMYDFMTIEPVETLYVDDWEPNISEIVLYNQPYLDLKIEQNGLYDYSLIRINLDTKEQETIIEDAPTIIETLGVYNNYMYCAYPTMDAGYYNGFARISLGENPEEEKIEENTTSKVLMYENKIYYLKKDGSNGRTNSVLQYYDVISETKKTLKTWKNHDMDIKEIKNGIIYLEGIQTNQQIQYNIKTGKVKNVKYMKPLKGVKVTHKIKFDKKKMTMTDVCKISWDKSYTGKIEIGYGTNSNTNKTTYGNKEKRIKATKKKNYCFLNLTSGKKYYIVLRAYKGKEYNEIYSVDSKVFTFGSRKITSYNCGKESKCNYIKKGKNIYYSCKENGKYYIYKKNTKTGKQKTILQTEAKIRLLNATSRYFYYQKETCLYVYDAKKHTKKKMKSLKTYGDFVDCLMYVNGKVIFYEVEEEGAYVEPTIYLYHADGSNHKKIGEGSGVFVYKKNIYWQKTKLSSNETLCYCYCKCDLNGKNKKTVTKWIPENDYWKIASKVDGEKKTYLRLIKNKKWKK